MRDPNRINEICELLVDKWKRFPDQRLGQFLENYVFGHHTGVGRHTDGCIFYQEDDLTERRLRDL